MIEPEIHLAPCRLEDTEAVLDLWCRAGAVPGPTDHPAGLALRLERDADLFLLAWAGDRLVGSLMGGWDGWRGNVYRLAVDPAFRRRGIARSLVLAVENALRARGAVRITCLVYRLEPGAPEFWHSVGYEPDLVIERYTKDLDEEPTDGVRVPQNKGVNQW